jgi:hypothetical protein
LFARETDAMSDSNAGVPTPRLADAVRQARMEIAERSGVVVDLRDAELARLEMLNEALDPIYADIPANIELFDRGVVPGDPPRLWIDMIAHVVMGRDRRVYRFVQDTRFGRRIIAESAAIDDIVAAVTKYVARRLVERERAIAADTELLARDLIVDAVERRRRRRRLVAVLCLGLVLGALLGAAALLAAAWLTAYR